MMRRLLIILVLLGAGALCHAQEIREVDGKKYIAHTVLKGQTLYAISKHYAVPVEVLTATNPGTAQGLSLGQVLLIPVKAQVKKDLRSAPALMDGELAHTVLKKETLFGIAHTYGVDQSDLLARNPELANGVREGMVVVIPVSRVANVPASEIAPAVDDHSTAHLVQPGETIYSLSKRFNVTEEQIRALNGGLPQGLKNGTYVRIPAQVVAPEPPPPPTPVLPPTAQHKVAFLLPFSIDANDSTQARDHKGYYRATDAAVQFYAGAQMAVDSMRSLGLSLDVQVRDMGDGADTWTQVVADPAVRDVELCIGPFHRAAIEKLGRMLPNAHIVCPVPQSNKVLLGNRNVSKVIGGRPDQMQQIARFVAAHHASDNIILAALTAPGGKDSNDLMMRNLNSALAGRPGRLRDSVLVVHCEKRDVTALLAKLSATQNNVVVVPSEDVEFVTTVLNKLAGTVPAKRVVVYGTGDWADLGTLDAHLLETLHVRIPASTFIDRDSPQVVRFTRQYRDRFQNEPGDYAFLGFDVTLYYLRALQLYGPALDQHFDDVDVHPMQMDLHMTRAGEENGFRNESGVMLEYQAAGLRRIP